jgi:phosphate acetyltransferase
MADNGFPKNAFEKYMASVVDGYNKSIVYVDGEDKRLAKSLKVFRKFNKSRTILLGNKDVIYKNLKDEGITADGLIDVIEPKESKDFGQYVDKILEIFKAKDKEISLEKAEDMVSSPNYFASIMLKLGKADGGVSGSLSSTASMMRPLIQVIGTGKDKRFLSGAAMEIIPGSPFGLKGQFLFADTAVIPEPDEKQLEDIAYSSYKTASALFEGEPRVAMLSYSTKGSAEGEKIQQIRRVVKKIKEIDPKIKIDGELQFDAAIDPEVAKIKLKDSEVAGKANVLIGPNLAATNILIKAVHRLANAHYYGSIIQGAPIPFNDLSRGCFPIDIATLSFITLMQLKKTEG